MFCTGVGCTCLSRCCQLILSIRSSRNRCTVSTEARWGEWFLTWCVRMPSGFAYLTWLNLSPPFSSSGFGQFAEVSPTASPPSFGSITSRNITSPEGVFAIGKNVTHLWPRAGLQLVVTVQFEWSLGKKLQVEFSGFFGSWDLRASVYCFCFCEI